MYFRLMLPIVKDPEHPVEATADYLIHEMDLNNLALTMDKWASQSTIGDFSMVEMNIALRTIELWKAARLIWYCALTAAPCRFWTRKAFRTTSYIR